MNHQATAKIVGALFIIATLSSIVSGTLVQNIITSPSDLANVYPNQTTLTIGVILLLSLAVSVVLIPSFLYPYLKKSDEKIALGYFAIRLLEALTPLIDALSLLLLISLGKEFSQTASPDSLHFQTLANLLLSARNWAFMLNPIIFGFGAILLYRLTYQSKIVPAWLSVWGLVGSALVLIAGIMGMFGNFIIFLAFPILIQEMVMAGWFIVKGFDLPKQTN